MSCLIWPNETRPHGHRYDQLVCHACGGIGTDLASKRRVRAPLGLRVISSAAIAPNDRLLAVRVVTERLGALAMPANPGNLNPGEIRRFSADQITTTCARCGVFSVMDVVGQPPGDSQQNPGFQTFAVLRCQGCRRHIAVEATNVNHPTAVDFYEIGRIYPMPSTRTSVAAVPDSIVAAMDEALACSAAGAVTAGALVCRRAIQLIARDRGTVTGNLKDEIDALPLSEDLKQIAHAVRVVANEAAHPNPLQWDAITANDLDELARFTIEMLRYIYELPAHAAELRARLRPPQQ